VKFPPLPPPPAPPGDPFSFPSITGTLHRTGPSARCRRFPPPLPLVHDWTPRCAQPSPPYPFFFPSAPGSSFFSLLAFTFPFLRTKKRERFFSLGRYCFAPGSPTTKCAPCSGSSPFRTLLTSEDPPRLYERFFPPSPSPPFLGNNIFFFRRLFSFFGEHGFFCPPPPFFTQRFFFSSCMPKSSLFPSLLPPPPSSGKDPS